MGEVATEIRVLQVFQTFARLKRPLRLSELAAEIGMPVSSCFALVRRLSAEGHLFEPVEKRAYYPTGKLRQWTAIIAAHDPIVRRIEPMFEALRDDSGETVTLAKLSGTSCVYVAAVESRSAIRMAGRVGVVRPVHAVAAGKALLASLSADERKALLGRHAFERLTPATRRSLAQLEPDILEGLEKGYFVSREESAEGAMAVAVTVGIAEQVYAVQIAGPVARVEANFETIVGALKEAVGAVDEEFAAAARA